MCSEQKKTQLPSSVFVFQKLKHTESDKLQVQIQAYLDNVFDVGALLEDAETKNAALERVEELEENLSHVSVSASGWKNRLNGLISSLSLLINVQQIRMSAVQVPVIRFYWCTRIHTQP